MTAGSSEQAVISERAVLGAVVQSAEHAAHAASLLAAENFGSWPHGAVFAAAARLADAGHPVSVPQVLAELGPDLARVVNELGEEFMADLIAAAGDIGYHALRVKSAWQQRQAVKGLAAARALAAAPGWDPDDTPARIRTLVDAATETPGTSPLRTARDLVDEVIESLADAVDPGLPTGFADLDEVTGGLRAGELVVVAARPGVGKSAVALTIAEHACTRLGVPGLYSSLEMTAETLTHRRIAAAAGVPLLRLTRHQLTDRDWDRVRSAHGTLTGSPLLIDDARGVSPAHIRGRLRAMARAGAPARLAVVDYVGLMRTGQSERRAEVSEATRAVRDIAGEHGIPVLLLAQLRRGGAARPDRRPHLEDLKETGELEEAADIVLLLHREDYYDRESPRAGEMDVIVAKNRQGPQCTVTVAFQGHYARVADLAPPEWTPSGAANGRGRMYAVPDRD